MSVQHTGEFQKASEGTILADSFKLKSEISAFDTCADFNLDLEQPVHVGTWVADKIEEEDEEQHDLSESYCSSLSEDEIFTNFEQIENSVVLIEEQEFLAESFVDSSCPSISE